MNKRTNSNKLYKKSAAIIYIIVTIFVAHILSGCSGTRNLSKPVIEVPETYLNAGSDTTTIASLTWREFYTDSLLRNYIEITLANNRDFLAAGEKVNELGQLYGVQKLNYYPRINGLVGELRETNDYYDEKHYLDTEISVKATLNWEADLWGALSYARQQAGAKYKASVEDLRAMQITLVSQVATYYYTLVGLKNELNIVRQTLITREQSLDKAKLRFEGGLTSELVYQQATVEYATTASLVPQLRDRISLCENALNLLMGRLADTPIEINIGALDDNLAETLPVGVPSQILQNRPDVQSSELALKAALANCGVTYSNQFPKLVIGITAGWENDEFKYLFQSPFTYVLGNIVGTIFDFGRNRRRYKSSIAAYEQAKYKYEKSVLAAFGETSGAITTYNERRKTASLRKVLYDAASKYVSLANMQYNAGSINYIDVLDAHRRYFDAWTGYSNAVRDEYLAMIDLYKALGGGM